MLYVIDPGVTTPCTIKLANLCKMENQRKLSLHCFHQSFRLKYIVVIEDTDRRHHKIMNITHIYKSCDTHIDKIISEDYDGKNFDSRESKVLRI